MDTARKEFLENGFQGSSLRQIVKKSGVTTGAFYGYFASKEDLFDFFVEDSYAYFIREYQKVHSDFKKIPLPEQIENMGKSASEWMMEIVDYIYDHADAFKLILTASEGTKYEHFIHEIVVIEVDGTNDFMNALRAAGMDVPQIDLHLEHILASGMFSAFFEIIIHDYPKEQAKKYLRDLLAFQVGGWEAIMNLKLRE